MEVAYGAADLVHGPGAALLMFFVAPPAEAELQGERQGPGALGSRLRGNDEINRRAIGYGLGGAA